MSITLILHFFFFVTVISFSTFNRIRFMLLIITYEDQQNLSQLLNYIAKAFTKDLLTNKSRLLKCSN